MMRFTTGKRWLASILTMAVVGAAGPAFAQSMMQQCGQQYQAAKAANTLNGMTWNQYRADCTARLKATPAAVQTATPPAPPIAANPLKPVQAAPPPAAPPPAAPPPAAPMPKAATAAPTPTPAAPVPAAPATTAAGKPMSAGRAAFVTRERQCGSEWRANKVTLVAQTPGLTWPKYLSQCNTRLKAAGQ